MCVMCTALLLCFLFTSCFTFTKNKKDSELSHFQKNMIKPSAEQLSSNQIRYKTFHLSLPKGWYVFAPNDTQGSSIKLNFFHKNSKAYGKYEIIYHPQEQKLTPKQIIALLISEQHGKSDSMEVHKHNNGTDEFYILFQGKVENSHSTLPLIFLTSKDNKIHLVQFMLDASSGSPQKLYNYIFYSYGFYNINNNQYRYDYCHRYQAGSINFFQNSSTFRWYSDTPSGIILLGTILDNPAFITIEKAETEKKLALTEKEALPILINNRRVWVHPRSQILKNGIYKMETVFTWPGSEVTTQGRYTLSFLIDSQGQNLKEIRILNDKNLKNLFQRELFFPHSGAEE